MTENPGVLSPSSRRKLNTSYAIRTLSLEFIKTLRALETNTSWTQSLETTVSGTCLSCLVGFCGRYSYLNACMQLGRSVVLFTLQGIIGFYLSISSKVGGSSRAGQKSK